MVPLPLGIAPQVVEGIVGDDVEDTQSAAKEDECREHRIDGPDGAKSRFRCRECDEKRGHPAFLAVEGYATMV
jgi:hypothetical protein